MTPEAIADHTAVKFAYQFNAASTLSTTWTICDAFCGVGGNAIAFAKQGFRVLAIDIDQTRLDCARHNAEIYNVAHLITFIHGDFMELALLNKIEADAVFLSPPWGGVEYARQTVFDIQSMPIDGVELFQRSRKVSENICYFLLSLFYASYWRTLSSKVQQPLQLRCIFKFMLGELQHYELVEI